MKATATIEFDVPEGYEFTGEWRFPREGEFFLYQFHRPEKASPFQASINYSEEKYPILRKAEVWQQLTEARVRDLFMHRTKVKLRRAGSHTPIEDDRIRDIYYSACDILCLRARVRGEYIDKQFLPKEIEYVEVTK